MIEISSICNYRLGLSWFCTLDFFLFTFAAFSLGTLVETEDTAICIADETQLPTDQWWTTHVVFMTSFVIDFVSWLWTVNEEKGRLFHLAFVINGIPAVSYGLLARGYGPILVDRHGRRLVTMRYLHWFCTTPAMLYLYTRISSIPPQKVQT